MDKPPQCWGEGLSDIGPSESHIKEHTDALMEKVLLYIHPESNLLKPD